MDLPGTCLVLAAVICLLLALGWGGVEKPWGSADVIGTLVGFGVITVVFGLVERWQGNRALLLGRILRRREVWSGCLFSFFLAGGFFALLYYIPIYFQAVRDTSATDSGIRNLALIIADTITVVASGILITKLGYFAPLVILGSVLTTVGSGMIYTFNTTSSSGVWIGYQALAGLGIGLCFQVPIMAGQALSPPKDISATTAIILFFQTIGGALFVSTAEAVFANEFISSLRSHVQIGRAHV